MLNNEEPRFFLFLTYFFFFFFFFFLFLFCSFVQYSREQLLLQSCKAELFIVFVRWLVGLIGVCVCIYRVRISVWYVLVQGRLHLHLSLRIFQNQINNQIFSSTSVYMYCNKCMQLGLGRDCPLRTDWYVKSTKFKNLIMEIFVIFDMLKIFFEIFEDLDDDDDGLTTIEIQTV